MGSSVDPSVLSRKRKRNEEDAELEETVFIVFSVVTVLLDAIAWYHNEYIDLEEPSSATKKKVLCTRAIKKRDNERIINSIMRDVAESLKDLLQVTKKRMEGNSQEMVQEVLNEMKMIIDIDDTLRYKAINWLTENPNRLAILKALPLIKKKDFLLASMS